MGIFDQMNYLRQSAPVSDASPDVWYDARTDRLITATEEQWQRRQKMEMMLQQLNAAAPHPTPKPAESEWKTNKLHLLTP